LLLRLRGAVARPLGQHRSAGKAGRKDPGKKKGTQYVHDSTLLSGGISTIGH
jgi:hypothetical protein